MLCRDLVFFHAPSLYDFRKYPHVFGPISDVIPSSPVFEMYPVGITSIADYLVKRGLKVQIINLAYRMLKDLNYDVEAVIRRTRSRYFALDLHWLPHAQGSLEIAALLKKYHPHIPIIFGGLSSSYYHQELLAYPQVDFVVRGDSTERPVFHLIETLDERGDLTQVPNLTFRRGEEIVVNPLSHVPEDIDSVSIPSYKYVISSVLKYRSLHNTIPYEEWLEYPTTLILTSRGCTYNCVICGGSCYSFKNFYHRKRPAFRSPERLLEDIRFITSFSSAPIFVIHDVRQGGEEYTERFFHLLSKENVENEFVFELFDVAPKEYLELIHSSVKRYNLQMSLESHLERIRSYGGKFISSNKEVEETMVYALENGCRKIDLFFMVGLPGQTYEDALGSVDYCSRVLPQIGEKKIWPFIAPLAPFLDPGSLAFEKPEVYGYKKLCHTLEDHRKALLEPSWKYMLSYETEWMDRDTLVQATYDAALGMNRVKGDLGLLHDKTCAMVEKRINASLEILKKVDEIYHLPLEERDREMERLKEPLDELGRYSICDERELRWVYSKGLRDLFSLGMMALRFLYRDVVERRMIKKKAREIERTSEEKGIGL